MSHRSCFAVIVCRAACLAAGLMMLCGCDKKEDPRARDAAGSKSTKSAARSEATRRESTDDFFASHRVIELALDLTPSQLETLKNNKDSHAYVRCTVREGGRTLADVGIHCKGDPAKEFASGKPDFTVTFDKFVPRQEFHGLRRVILQGSREDPSYLSAPMAFGMFRDAGVPAPRCGFARIALNGRALGLYVLIEGVNRDFLRRHFGESDGNLYDEGEHTDVTGKLDKDSGGDRNDQSDVDALAAATRQADPDQRWKQLQQWLDTERFLAFTALEVLLWQKDSYALEARKFRIYHNPTNDLLVFLPKGVERVLEKSDGAILPDCKGVVAKAVLTTPAGQEQYRQTVSKLLGTVFSPSHVQSRAREIAARIRPSVGGDAEQARAFDAAVEAFIDAATRRAAFAAEQFKSTAAK